MLIDKTLLLKRTVLKLSFSFFLLVFTCYDVNAQKYLGLGIHFAPPVRIENCCNTYIKTKPSVIPAFSFSYKKEWKGKKKGRHWYYEAGLTSSGLRLNYQRYRNEASNPWIEFYMSHIGFPSIMYGMGRRFLSTDKRHDFSTGLEFSYRISHDLGGLLTNDFGLLYSPGEITSPLFIRLNLGYSRRFMILKKIPSHLQFYTKLSIQDVARSNQYIRDPVTGQIDNTGIYSLNNSELGIKLYTNIAKENFRFDWAKKKKKKRKNNGPSKFRFSIDGQLFAPSPTEYHIPQVDSFLLDGLNFSLTNQIALKVEFIHAKNDKWSTLLGIGFGTTTGTTRFRAASPFVPDGLLLDQYQGGAIGNYLIPQIGLSYKHPIGKSYLQHSLSSTFAFAATKRDASVRVLERSFLGIPPHLVPRYIVDGEFSHKYRHDPVLPGFEYQPELLIKMDKRIFYGIGFVFNYSFGLMAQGRIKVDNGRTQYFGGITQGFSKIGISARIGWNSTKQD